MSGYVVVTLPEENLEEWARFVETPLHLTTQFSSLGWGRLLTAANGAAFVVHALVQKDRIVGGVAGHWRRELGLKVFRTHPLAPYNGWCQIGMENFDASKRQRFIMEGQQSLASFLKKEYHLVSLINPPAITDLRGFLWAGFYLETRYTYCIELRDRDRLWSRLNPDVRTKVRKAERQGWMFHPEKDAESLLELLGKTRKRQNYRIPYSDSTLRSLLDNLLARKLISIFAVYVEGSPAAAVAIFNDCHGVLHEWLAGTRVDETTTGAFQYLFWKVLEFYLDSGKGWQSLDMDGAGIRGVSYMKSHYGGKLLPVTHALSYGMAIMQIFRRAFKRTGIV